MQTCDTDSILHSGKCVIYEDERISTFLLMALENMVMDPLKRIQLVRYIMFPGLEVLFGNLDVLIN